MLTVVLACDDRFALPAAMAGRSAALRASRPVRVVVLDAGLSLRSIDALRCAVGVNGARVDVIVPDVTSIRALPVSDRYPLATYFKLLAPALLRGECERFVWLDADTFVRADLSTMPVPDGVHAMAAARDWFLPTARERRAALSDASGWQGVADELSLFNAGVLHVDVNRWTELDLTRRVIDRLRSHAPSTYPLPEQDALAIELAGAWTELPPEWNAQAGARGYWQMRRSAERFEASLGFAFDEVVGRANVLHWTGMRPWRSAMPASVVQRYVGALLASVQTEYLTRLDDMPWPSRAARRISRTVRGAVDAAKAWRHRARMRSETTVVATNLHQSARMREELVKAQNAKGLARES
jgi:lipopolysaccharide biosynthesis glycosyltransferase